ncbi:MAG: response regulator [Candidatus Omnitrophota bacterium]
MAVNDNLKKDDMILIVDDDKTVRDFLQKYLNQKGFAQVISVGSGEEAVNKVKTEDIKLVFLDVKMPGLTGIDVLRQIKKIKKDTGVIMITGYPEEEVTQEAIKEGAYDYIIKPFDLAYLELSLLSKIAMMK